MNENRTRKVVGNIRPEVKTGKDLGRVNDSLLMDHMILQLGRSTEQEQDLQTYLINVQNPDSPTFHRWLTPAEFGAKYGPAPEDIAKITAWLESNSFTVNSVAPGGMTIDFSGSAAAVRKSLRTEMHHIEVDGTRHVANVSDPEIPEAFAPVVRGVVSLHDFAPRAMKTPRPAYTYTEGTKTYHAIVPGDLATIYNLTPLFAAGVTGKGQTVVVIEDTDLSNPSDWNTFRTKFGLDKFTSGSLVTVHPPGTNGVNNCRAPGVNGDESEAVLDVEWASAAAPDATIVLASCKGSFTTFGGLIALQNLVNSSAPPAVISISYGECEAALGASTNAAYSSVFQQAVAEGISMFVASGDEGAASCDANRRGATHGIGVSGFASTPYNVAVGGTDFGDTSLGITSAYWSATNSSTYASALSYIPEIPWNDSCAGAVLASYNGYSGVYGSMGFCASAISRQKGYLTTTAGSGGPSGCATGAPSSFLVVSGTCAGYAKPSWQAGVPGIPADGVRGIPDVSLFAANGVWGHYYVFCWSNTSAGASGCTGEPSTWDGAGGTSFSSPILAGIQALVNQKNGGAQGNPNPVYYKLAATSANFCNSSAPGAGCIFYNTTRGDIDVNCSGDVSCFGDEPVLYGLISGANYNGALSTSSTTLAPAFKAGPGWNFATGLGSVNAYNLVNNWKSGR